RAEALLADGDVEAARPLLEEALDEEPEHEGARALLARTLALTDPERAAALTDGLYTPEADAVRTLARLRRLADDPEALPDAPVKAVYLAAAEAVRAGDVDAALERLVGVVQRDRSYDDDGARKAAVALFVLLGEADPAVQKHRPVFNRSLY
ncbi:MAG: tetratricopeptide repeat protein, partial [Rhodothermales bacterium]|nr:tetratricopeptide repeat protein [Rhodothermales bacterium]